MNAFAGIQKYLTALTVVLVLLGIGVGSRGAVSPFSSAHADSTPNLSGTFLAEDPAGNIDAMYFVNQVDSTVWWTGMSMDPSLALDQQFHRGLDVTNVFKGTVSYDSTLGAWVAEGDWVDVSRGAALDTGTVTMKITGTDAGGNVSDLDTQAASQGFSSLHWSRYDLYDALHLDNPDMYERFTEVEKSPDAGLIFQKPGSLEDEGLKPYRDETVFYGRVTSTAIGDDGPVTEVPTFDDSNVPTSYKDFICDTSEDHDLNFNMAADQNRFEPNFSTTGWDGRDPQDVLQKLYDATAQSDAGLNANESYIHAEIMMYGHTANCDAAKNGDTGRPLYPGWGDTGSNSLLVNGIPVNGHVTQLYGYDVNTQSYYKTGVQFNGQSMLPGDKIRITGAMILDCGHGDLSNPTGDCHTGNTYSDDQGAQNQEIHPVFSIDVIHHDSAHTNLTGAWGGDDGSTFYIRQIGNAIWMLGLYRDREPLVPDGSSAPMQTYATVFKGTIAENSDGSATISGSGDEVPYPGESGGGTYNATFNVDSGRAIITTSSANGGAPFASGFQFNKLYEPPDGFAPSSSLTIGTPQYTVAGSTQPFVTGATPFTVNASDDNSGVQNIWYRFYPKGSTPPAFTPVDGSSGSFTLSGADGVYEVDTYATDNAGNDEVAHSQFVYLDNSAPAITITQPTATNYTHSDALTLNYTVDDGAGSGVAGTTPTMDGQTTVAGHGLQSGQSINLLTDLALGTHTFSVDAQDNLGNETSQSVTFSIVVTAQSIMGDVNQFVASGDITQNEGTSLLSKLNSAAKTRADGNCPNAATIYQSFISEVQAQTGKKINSTAASIMIGDAQYLIAHCP